MLIKWMEYCKLNPGKVRSEDGFTLVEVILIFVVVSILSSSLVLPFLSNLNDGTRADIYANAAQLASAEIERLRGVDYAVIVAGLGANPSVEESNGGNFYTINNRTYGWRLVTTLLQDDLATQDVGGDYMEIEATVVYPQEAIADAGLTDVSVTLTGIITKDFH